MKPEDAKRLQEIRKLHPHTGVAGTNWADCQGCFLLRVIDEQAKRIEELELVEADLTLLIASTGICQAIDSGSETCIDRGESLVDSCPNCAPEIARDLPGKDPA